MNESIAEQGRTIAFFDFDGTLAQDDSLWPFLVAVAGLPRCLCALAKGVFFYLFPCGRDRRTAVKEILLSTVLEGKHLSALVPAVERMRVWPRWMKTADDLRDHFAKGHHVVIATGSLNLYVKEMLGDMPYHAILCTEMEIIGGVLTGRMASGNCVRKRKAERVAEYLLKNGPFADSWAYGNLPHDLPMMELANHRVII